MKLNSIESNKRYEIAGSELIKFNEAVQELRSEHQWMRNFLRESLNIITDESSIPKFVARIGMAIANLDEYIVKLKNSQLNEFCAGIEVIDVQDMQDEAKQ